VSWEQHRTRKLNYAVNGVENKEALRRTSVRNTFRDIALSF
jgi:hypothetical protein